MTNKNGHHSYPLMDNVSNTIKANSGRPLTEITLEAVSANELGGEDLQIKAETLQAQAEIARKAGFVQLAANLSRAAELTAVPNQVLLDMYETLRPKRATYDELQEMAEMLELTYNAPENAKYVREAATAYKARGLLQRA